MDVSQFLDSPEMREHLKDIQLSERVCEELVCGAPRTLADKVAWLEHRGSNLTKETRRALHSLELKPGEFLFLVEEWYDFDSCGRSTSYSYYGMPFPSLEHALSHIRQVMAEEEWNNDSLFWTKLDKFMLGKDGVYHHLYTYYLIKDEVVYFETNPSRPQNCFCGASDLNVPIPFKAGDIVAIDCKPFMPPNRWCF